MSKNSKNNVFTVFRLLVSFPNGLYSSELVRRSEGRLRIGTIYPVMNRVAEMGLVSYVSEPATATFRIARNRYFITKSGRETYFEFLREHHEQFKQLEEMVA